MRIGQLVLVWMLIAGLGASAQLARRDDNGADPAGQAHRTRLILKDGSYQIVTSYTVTGTRVKYVSAERGGATEEIPLALVDLQATQRWEARHAADTATAGAPAATESRPAPAIDPELLKEEADRAAVTPEVATDLRLPPEDGVVVLDTYRGGAELVPLTQSEGDLNKQTGHNILKAAVNPLAASHQIVVLKGEKADVQMHVDQPEIFIRLDDALAGDGQGLVVDTHGASAAQGREKKGAASKYVIVRTDVRKDARVVASFNTSVLGGTSRQEDVVETETTVLPGGHWMKVVPREHLLVGEYALVEVLGEKSINLGVWDFGVHPAAPENRDLILPEKRRTVTLGKRGRE